MAVCFWTSVIFEQLPSGRSGDVHSTPALMLAKEPKPLYFFVC